MAAKGTSTTKVYEKNGYTIIKWSWTSDSGGDVDECGQTGPFTGTILEMRAVPDTTDKPTNLYDLDIKNGDGVELVSEDDWTQAVTTATNTRRILDASSLQINVVDSELYLVVSNAGDTKKGVVYLMLK